MELSKKQKEFIKSTYSSSDVCREWKGKIKDNFPEVFENDFKLVVGKWYKSTNMLGEYLICIVDVAYGKYSENSISHRHYGFQDGKWASSWSWSNTDFSLGLVEATDSEVKEALLNEAKKRGFKKGVRYNPIFDITKSETKGIISETIGPHGTDRLSGGFQYIYRLGEWATIIETITKDEAQKQLGKTIVG